MEKFFEIFLSIIPWIAVVALPLGYWKQVWHIHKHREVRDLNLTAFILFLIAYISLGIEAFAIISEVFIWKNILVAIPTIVIIWQIYKYKNSTWIDDEYRKMKEKNQDKKSLNKRINLRDKDKKEDEDYEN